MKRFLGFVLFVNGLLLAADSPQMAALADTLFKSCTNKQCDFLIQIESNQLLSIDTLSALQEASIQNDFAKTETAETLPPISDECREMCDICATDSSQNTSCERIEKLCKCSAYFPKVDSQAVDTLSADTSAQQLSPLQLKFLRVNNVYQNAESVFQFCDTVSYCRIELRLDTLTFKIQTLKLAPEEISAPVETIAVIPEDIPAESDSLNDSENFASDTTEADSLEEPQEEQTFYTGILLEFGKHEETIDIDHYRNFHDTDENALDMTIGYAVRKYFNRYLSLQSGLNYTVTLSSFYDEFWYHGYVYNNDYSGRYIYKDVENAANLDITLIRHSLEIPLQIRFGKSFFASYSLIIRKPLFSIYSIEGDANYPVYNEPSDRTTIKENAKRDWEFYSYLGVGYEISRVFSVELKLAGLGISHSTAEELDVDNGGFSFRTTMSFVW